MIIMLCEGVCVCVRAYVRACVNGCVVCALAEAEREFVACL